MNAKIIWMCLSLRSNNY